MKLAKAIAWTVVCVVVGIGMPIDYWHDEHSARAVEASIFTVLAAIQVLGNAWMDYCGLEWKIVEVQK